MSSRARRHNGAEIDSVAEIEQLMSDLQALVDADLVVEVRELGLPSRYALTVSGHDLASCSAAVSHVYPVADWPEPCPACGAREGFDGGGRCYRCHIAWPPEM
jgi:hypothetical protein